MFIHHPFQKRLNVSSWLVMGKSFFLGRRRESDSLFHVRTDVSYQLRLYSIFIPKAFFLGKGGEKSEALLLGRFRGNPLRSTEFHNAKCSETAVLPMRVQASLGPASAAANPTPTPHSPSPRSRHARAMSPTAVTRIKLRQVYFSAPDLRSKPSAPLP